MSHFVVMVTDVDKVPLDEQLEPFYEQGEEGDYFMEKEYYLENNDKDINEWLDREIKLDQERITQQEEKISEVKPEERKGYENHLKWLRKSVKKLERIKALKTTKGKLKAIKNYNGGGLDKNGLYWLNNPNAKWDWWVEGGRWDGWLVKKNGERCNRCKVKEVDFEGMKKAQLEDRAKYYDEEIERAKKDGVKPMFWGYKETPTKEEYVNGAKIYVSPYAVLHEEEWHEKGSMGWFGIDDPKFTEDDWENKFLEFFKTLDPETEIAIVDCHI